MCGRFANNAKKKVIEKEFKIGKLNKVSFDARYNIALSQMIDAVLETDAERILTKLKWGLIPIN
ncbi:MAG TPA: SOS response-associated peptidase family protein [Pyrinomonadaceae bacterium]|jgi:putative SOS response-associated peptidase YedK|nr:SOS response-associated peptidase family protein [Pyrinomonadaceae bacterium]